VTYEDILEEIKYHNMLIKRSKRKLAELFVIREEKRNEDQISIDEILRP